VLHAGFSMKRLGRPDPAFQPRVVHLDMDHVKTLDDIYQVRGSLDPVVIVHVAEEDRNILVDGFHRHEVYKRAGEGSIPAYVITGTVEDATEYAAMANQHAILKRTPLDVKKQIYMLMQFQQWVHSSDPALAAHVGVSSMTARRYRGEYYTERNIPVPKEFVSTSGVKRKRKFSDDTPSINKTPYGRYTAKVKGKRITLGTDFSQAKAMLEEITGRSVKRMARLNPVHFFGEWLPQMGIHLTPSRLLGPNYYGIGYSAHGYGRVVITARLDEPSAIYTAIGRLYALREILQRPGDRLVMVCVCYPDDGPAALVEVARRLGVELLTPEELVASIKGDGDQAAPAPAGPAAPDLSDGEEAL
jgi:hypothetical protein